MNTNAPEEYKENCLMKIGEIWKKWKVFVKKTYYIPIKDDPTALLISPDRVRPEDWAKLVPHWQTQKSEDEAQRNKRNRQQYEFPHRAGKTSFANIRREMDNKGEDVSRTNVFLKTRSMGNGPSPQVLEIVQEMKIAPSHSLESQQTAADKDKVFIEFMGRDGHSSCKDVW